MKIIKRFNSNGNPVIDFEPESEDDRYFLEGILNKSKQDRAFLMISSYSRQSNKSGLSGMTIGWGKLPSND